MTNESRQYALALFTLALENNELKKVRGDFSKFILSVDAETMSFMKHPLFQKEEKKAILDKVVHNHSLKHFLFVLVDNFRFDSIVEIHQAFEELILHQEQILQVTIYSKQLLSEPDLSRVQNKLEKEHHQKVVINNVIDDTILAGHRIEYSGYIHDSSVNRKLSDLVSELKKN